MDRVPDTNEIYKIEWELDGVPDKVWRKFFEAQIANNPQIAQRNFIDKIGYNKQDFSPKLNNQSITFYTTPKKAENYKNLIQQAIDATNEQIREYNKRITELNKKEEEDKQKDEETKNKMFENDQSIKRKKDKSES